MNSAVERYADQTPRPHLRIGEILRAAQLLTDDDIRRVLARQRARGQRFGEAAVELRLVTMEEVRRALSEQVPVPAMAATSTLSPLLLAALDPFGRYSEALRSLRSELLLHWFGSKRHTLAITSPSARGDHSVLAANLAIAFSQLGERTILVDANLRTPRQRELFGVTNDFGLVDILRESRTLDESIQPRSPLAHLSLLCAGIPPSNPQELLSGTGFRALVEQLALTFDVVIFDTPPTLECADAKLVATRAGGVLIAAWRHRTALCEMARSCEALSSPRCAVVGTVLHD